MRWEYADREAIDLPAHGLFIVNEGNFQYGNATLSFYDPETGETQNELFIRANGMRLGDVAQSMTIYNKVGWVCVNNSHVLFAIDPTTCRELGRITGLTSPRYVHFISPRKAYVTQLWDNRIAIIDPQTFAITGHITVPGMEGFSGSTEQMIQVGTKVYCNCWSYQNRIIRIDTETDQVDAELTIGIQPNSIALDAEGRLWALTDGGFEGNPLGQEAPALWRINLDSFAVEKVLRLPADATPTRLQSAHGVLYWLDRGVWTLDGDSPKKIIPETSGKFYGLTISPQGEIYVADAIDYQQSAAIYRFAPDGTLIARFTAGITPGAFCWK